jgi:DNA-binding transcriptional ArsR family regulator
MSDEQIGSEQTQKVMLLSPEDEQTRLIGKAIASETAGKILSSMSGREVTAMVLAEELQIPVSTVMYHLENLASAGLIEVSKTRYSVKGREMKVYRLIDQVLIVSSKKQDVKTVLTRCVTLLSLPLAVACILAYVNNFQTWGVVSSSDRATGGGVAKMAMNTASLAMEQTMEAAPAPLAMGTPVTETFIEPLFYLSDLVLGILIGVVLVVLIGIFIDYHQKL